MPNKLSNKLLILLVLILIAVGILIGIQQMWQQLPAASPAGSLEPEEGLLANEELLPLAQCMRDNGVPTFPDPENGMIFDNARDIGADSQAFEAAWKTCESLLPQPEPGRSARTV